MAQYNDFEDLPIWQEARALAKAVYTLTNKGAFRSDRGLRDQVQRAIISVGSNVADGVRQHGDGPRHRRWPVAKRRAFAFGCPQGRIERNGFDRSTDKDFANFLTIAKGSIAEVRSQLYSALDFGYISESEQREVNQQLKQLGSQIGGFINYLRTSSRTVRRSPRR